VIFDEFCTEFESKTISGSEFEFELFGELESFEESVLFGSSLVVESSPASVKSSSVSPASAEPSPASVKSSPTSVEPSPASASPATVEPSPALVESTEVLGSCEFESSFVSCRFLCLSF